MGAWSEVLPVHLIYPLSPHIQPTTLDYHLCRHKILPKLSELMFKETLHFPRTFSINFLAIGWNSSFDCAKDSFARVALTLLAARNIGRQNFMRPLITPVPSRPVTQLSAWLAKSNATDDVGSLSAMW